MKCSHCGAPNAKFSKRQQKMYGEAARCSVCASERGERAPTPRQPPRHDDDEQPEHAPDRRRFFGWSEADGGGYVSENVLRSRSHLQLGPTGRIAGRKAILTRDASSSHRVWLEVPPPIHGRAASATIRAGNRGMLIVVGMQEDGRRRWMLAVVQWMTAVELKFTEVWPWDGSVAAHARKVQRAELSYYAVAQVAGAPLLPRAPLQPEGVTHEGRLNMPPRPDYVYGLRAPSEGEDDDGGAWRPHSRPDAETRQRHRGAAAEQLRAPKI
jgi:hypothetical protein